jgi:hypothetical protein
MSTSHNVESQVAQTMAELAGEDAPWVGVHVLGEFVYCSRAGFVAKETRKNDDGLEFVAAPALGGLPAHEPDAIQAALTRVKNELLPACMATVATVVLFAFLFRVDWLVSLCMTPAVYFCGRWLMRCFNEFRFLRMRWQAWEHSSREEPNWDLPAVQPVNWWNLLRAEFDSIEKPEPLKDFELKLAGKPWRFIRKGTTQLPVIRIKVDEDGFDPKRHGKLRPQQLARLTAYAFLANKCERLQAEWGIVLFGQSDDGLAIPLSPDTWSLFRNGLRHARKEISNQAQDRFYDPGAPVPANPCYRYPLGRPVRLTKANVFDGGVVEPFATEAENGRGIFHCLCGDRYRWVPPHDRARELGLG